MWKWSIIKHIFQIGKLNVNVKPRHNALIYYQNEDQRIDFLSMNFNQAEASPGIVRGFISVIAISAISKRYEILEFK